MTETHSAHSIQIDADLSSLIPPLSPDEYNQLEANLLADGCRDPLMIGLIDDMALLLDGHNRYRICQKHHIPFDAVRKEFDSREEATNWVINNQLGRRNLTPEQKSYLRGKRYNAEKNQGFKGNQHSGIRQNDGKQTAEQLADEYKVSPRTIERDGRFAEAVDTIATNVGVETKQQILSRENPVPKKEILRIAQLPPEEQNQQSVHFTSATSEWYTPPEIIKRVVAVLNEIDLDPCSNNTESPNVSAHQYFTQADDGLSRPWHGRVYMNPPYGREIIEWVKHLCSEYDEGRVQEALCLVPSRTDTEWFRRLKKHPRCFVWGRLHFSESENAAPFPSMVVYMGNQPDKFKEHFQDMGDIYIAL